MDSRAVADHAAPGDSDMRHLENPSTQSAASPDPLSSHPLDLSREMNSVYSSKEIHGSLQGDDSETARSLSAIAAAQIHPPVEAEAVMVRASLETGGWDGEKHPEGVETASGTPAARPDPTCCFQPETGLEMEDRRGEDVGSPAAISTGVAAALEDEMVTSAFHGKKDLLQDKNKFMKDSPALLRNDLPGGNSLVCGSEMEDPLPGWNDTLNDCHVSCSKNQGLVLNGRAVEDANPVPKCSDAEDESPVLGDSDAEDESPVLVGCRTKEASPVLCGNDFEISGSVLHHSDHFEQESPARFGGDIVDDSFSHSEQSMNRDHLVDDWPADFTADFGSLEGMDPAESAGWGLGAGDHLSREGEPTKVEDVEEDFGDFDDASFVTAPPHALKVEEKFEVNGSPEIKT